jgi:hypothetical protein
MNGSLYRKTRSSGSELPPAVRIFAFKTLPLMNADYADLRGCFPGISLIQPARNSVPGKPRNAAARLCGLEASIFQSREPLPAQIPLTPSNVALKLRAIQSSCPLTLFAYREHSPGNLGQILISNPGRIPASQRVNSSFLVTNANERSPMTGFPGKLKNCPRDIGKRGSIAGLRPESFPWGRRPPLEHSVKGEKP